VAGRRQRISQQKVGARRDYLDSPDTLSRFIDFLEQAGRRDVQALRQTVERVQGRADESSLDLADQCDRKRVAGERRECQPALATQGAHSLAETHGVILLTVKPLGQPLTAKKWRRYSQQRDRQHANWGAC
jgi:hypothetical protein